MGTKEIEEVMIRACADLGIVGIGSIYVSDDFPEGPADERIVIHVKPSQRGTWFYKGFVEVNAVVPDVSGRADHERLEAVEKTVVDAFRYDVCGTFGNETYRYGLYSTEVLREPEAKFHFVNARLTFEILNI